MSGEKMKKVILFIVVLMATIGLVSGYEVLFGSKEDQLLKDKASKQGISEEQYIVDKIAPGLILERKNDLRVEIYDMVLLVEDLGELEDLRDYVQKYISSGKSTSSNTEPEQFWYTCVGRTDNPTECLYGITGNGKRCCQLGPECSRDYKNCNNLWVKV